MSQPVVWRAEACVQEAEQARDSLAQQLEEEKQERARISNLADDVRAELDAVSKAARQQCDRLQSEVHSKDSENMSLHQRMMQERARTAALEDKIRCALHAGHVGAGSRVSIWRQRLLQSPARRL